MKNQVQIFSNDQFGQVRAIEVNGEPRFVLKDICEVLGIQNHKDIKSRLDTDEVGRFNLPHPQNANKAIQVLCVNESGLYAVILRSDKPQAKQFRKWITAEVLPTLRKTGTYTVKQTAEDKARMLATREENIKVRKAQLLFRVSEKCGVESYKQVLHSHITLMLTGQELLPLPKAEHTTYTAAQIGEMLGISANMVGKLANRHGLKTEEFGEIVWDKSPYSAHQCQTFRYYISVVPVLQKLIEEVA